MNPIKTLRQPKQGIMNRNEGIVICFSAYNLYFENNRPTVVYRYGMQGKSQGP